MKILMFSKTELIGKYFRNNEDTTGFTDKIPPNTNYKWDDENDDWVPVEIENMIEEWVEPELEIQSDTAEESADENKDEEK